MKPTERRTEARQQELEDSVRILFEQKITFNAYVGLRVASLQPDFVSVEFDMRDELVGHYLHGRLHGGVISTALDDVGGLAVLWAISEYHCNESAEQIMLRFAHLGTVDLRVDSLRQGIGERFTASAQVIRLGRRIASTRMQLENSNGTLIATGNGAYIVS